MLAARFLSSNGFAAGAVAVAGAKFAYGISWLCLALFGCSFFVVIAVAVAAAEPSLC